MAEEEIETFSESIKVAAFVYALAAAVSLAVAWGIKLIFTGVQAQKARAEARAAAKASLDPGDGAQD